MMALQMAIFLQTRREYFHVGSDKNVLVFDGFAKRSPSPMLIGDDVAVDRDNY
jgi:hypothetical protein